MQDFLHFISTSLSLVKNLSNSQDSTFFIERKLMEKASSGVCSGEEGFCRQRSRAKRVACSVLKILVSGQGIVFKNVVPQERPLEVWSQQLRQRHNIRRWANGNYLDGANAWRRRVSKSLGNKWKLSQFSRWQSWKQSSWGSSRQTAGSWRVGSLCHIWDPSERLATESTRFGSTRRPPRIPRYRDRWSNCIKNPNRTFCRQISN